LSARHIAPTKAGSGKGRCNFDISSHGVCIDLRCSHLDRATASAPDFQEGKQCGAHQAREQRFQHEVVFLRKNVMDRCSNAVRRNEISNNPAARLPP
jgi:hypothetical protein